MATSHSLMRCRVRDLISCFNASKVPVEEEESDRQTPKQSPVSDDRKRKGKKKVEVDKTPERREGGGGGGESPASWKSCEPPEEDDYIVFSFSEGPAGADVIERRGVESWSGSQHHGVSCNLRNKENERGKMKVEASLAEGHKCVLSESSGSDSSFAFPKMSKEWPGSPVLMPRPEAHNKSCCVCIQCCKYL